jgi:hypothetical protein
LPIKMIIVIVRNCIQEHIATTELRWAHLS